MTSLASAEIRQLDSLDDVARYLGATPRQLGFLLRGRPESKRYTKFAIPKRRGGTRTILAPLEDLKWIQRSLAKRLEEIYEPRHAVHGFVADRSIVSNARKHVKRRYVFNVDLSDFFPTINFGRVRGLFLKLGAPPGGATVLAQICCHDGKVPQGSPTSPIISNMICHRLDRQLTDLAKAHHCVYSRYADDLTFSRKRASFPPEIGRFDEERNAVVGEKLRSIIEANGFRVNSDKVWLFDNKHRQTVTGLTVNAKCNVQRQFVRQIRAMIHAWAKHGCDEAEQEHATKYYRRRGRKGEAPSFEQIIRGKLEFVKMVKGCRDPVYRNLQTQFVRVCPDYLRVISQENALMKQRDVFISHASEDKDAIARPLAEALLAAGFSVWFDEYEIKIGDSLRGKIDEGLANSRFGVVIISKNFFAIGKTWTRRELDGLTAVEDVSGRNRILPVWHDVTRDEVAERSPTLAGLKALISQGKSPSEMVAQLADVLR